MKTEINKPLSGTLKTIFSELSSEPKQKNAKLTSVWPRIVGENIAKKTRVKFNRSGVTILTDTSALSYEISQKFGDTILKRLQHEFGESEIQKIWVNVGKID